EQYDRLSPPFQKLVEGLRIRYHSPTLFRAGRRSGKPYPRPHGAPENVGSEVLSSQPIVRTKPTTGWKALHPGVLFAEYIKAMTDSESKTVVEKIQRLIDESRHQLLWSWYWARPVMWDNRAVLHAATQDLDSLEPRIGWRSTSIDEKPYSDPVSVTRKQAL
ncbi:hypothetical protein B0J12DRAFT_545666, partial [Macrophomina phaseolina]